MPTAAAASAGLVRVADVDPQRLLAGVTQRERERYRALQRRPRRALQYLASRWLLRAHVAGGLGLQPTDVPLRTPAGGPPTLPDSGCRIGLSHSGDMCLCITSSHGRVGCDVEHRRPDRPIHDIAARFFHPAEATHLAGVSQDRAQDDFHRLWTLKEAAQKALGQGMAGGLRAPAFLLQPALHCLTAPTEAPWTFACCRFDDSAGRYMLALAMADTAEPMPFSVNDYTAIVTGPARRPAGLQWQIATVPDRTAGRTHDNNLR